MQVNGKQLDLDNITITALLEQYQLSADNVVIELNAEIVPKEQFNQKLIYQGDQVEIVSLFGGG